MTNSITRKFHLCFSRPKKCSPSSTVLAPGETHDDPNSAPNSSPTSSSSSSTLVFKDSSSLCDLTAALYSRSDTGSTSASATFFASTPETNSVAGDPDLSSAIACRRLLLPSSPRRFNAIADPAAIPVGFGVAVPTYSDDPYTEFRRSMEDMAEAAGILQGDPRGALGRRQERLQELLLCYLALNRKHAHRYIIDAFSDLFVISSESAAEAAAVGGDGPTEGGDQI